MGHVNLEDSQLHDKEKNIIKDEIIVSVKNISKKFCKNLKRSMAYGIGDLSKNLFGIKYKSDYLRKDEFWALNNINFEIRRGEILGLIGTNGSGKTTLIRLIAGVFPPDSGEIIIKGRVGALIAVGAGFHPHMTGRENIFLNGTILGMSKRFIESRFREIVDFAEIDRFLDAPVSTYSSGMRVRLGFAIAAQMDIDILLIDEVLAVGDAAFRIKCYDRISQLIERGATVVFVSHDTMAIKTYCSRVLMLKEGEIAQIGEPAKVVESYWHDIRYKEKLLEGDIKKFDWKRSLGNVEGTAFGTRDGSIVKAYFESTGSNQALFYSGEDIKFMIDVEFLDTLKKPSLCVIIQNQKLIEIGGEYFVLPQNTIESRSVKISILASFKAILSEGEYAITLRLEERYSSDHFFPIDKQLAALRFRIIHNVNDQLTGTVDFHMNWKIV